MQDQDQDHGIGWAVDQMRAGEKAEAIKMPEGTFCRFDPYVTMRTVAGSFVPWLCSQTDLLAVDWELAN